MTEINLELICSEVKKIALEAGTFIRTERAKFSKNEIETKGKNDYVSFVDRGSEKIIVDYLSQKFPEIGFIAEEGSGTKNEKLNWVIDPLDGTTNFIHGIPCYCVSIALVENETVLVGVVYEVSNDKLYSSFGNEKSYCNEQVISCSNSNNLNDCLIATGLPVNNFAKNSNYFEVIDFFMRNTRGVRRIGAAAADLCFVAEGTMDAFFEYNLKPWDVAAGILIAKNAGCIIKDFNMGHNFIFGGQIMCASDKISGSFFEVVSKKMR